MIDILLNLRSLRAQAREMSVADLQEGLQKFTQVVEERREEEEAANAINKEQEAKLQKYRDMLEAEGITAEELVALLGDAPKAKKKRAARPAKYKFTDENGEEKTWTGQGRTPKALQQLLDNGAQLSEFEI
ncbi:MULTISPECIES: H-NS family nucleoid-associated regulatory protein [unclassified Photobacterium]|uniref:H-NS histone family protein n=1 Tax=unclassified Photobacterium TaxID=2628852 RepID=UPI000D153DEE|nr:MULTISPECIES: H-NS family nucleoid-associated regulatory protein [unclassified Photobacterium]PSV26139.1 transcriptional regulator [Photobacterium sp. GB-56]PSV30837.1 transcriptional regulator [Photobacterium sp. GB-72]PSV37677.1 transcriptional regulator [Photobacterium sp. GB-210]PSV38321.1 transcriptional regulator [Photobacterium sp. GB-27]PSV44980.1 transcriptional regulator [Photobacterium sp. GB-36]